MREEPLPHALALDFMITTITATVVVVMVLVALSSIVVVVHSFVVVVAVVHFVVAIPSYSADTFATLPSRTPCTQNATAIAVVVLVVVALFLAFPCSL